jgi:hypothetical protein
VLDLKSYPFSMFLFLLPGMEKIKKFYNTHKEQLFQKFVSLIEDLMDSSFQSGDVTEAGPPIHTLSWDEPAIEESTRLEASNDANKAEDSTTSQQTTSSAASTSQPNEIQETSSAMKYFLHKIRILHKMLSKYLPPIQLQDVFARIISSINTKFPKIYASVQPMTDLGKQKVCNEIRVLLKVLRSLDGLREPGNTLQIHFRSRFGVAASQLL